MTAATAIYLHRLTGANDIVFGLPVAARNGAARNTPGMVSNVLPLRLALNARMTVGDAIAGAAAEIRRSLEHQRYQVADLRRDIGDVDDGRPLFGLNLNIMRFDYDFRFGGHRAEARNLSLGPVEDLSIQIYDRRDGGPLQIDFDANPERYDAERTVPRIRSVSCGCWTALAVARSSRSGRSICSARTSGDTILRTWNAPAAADAPTSTATPRLPDRFAEQAARTPDAVALVCDGEQPQLSRRSTRAPTSWRIICVARRRARDRSWGCASSARSTWWSGCSASSRPAPPTCRSIRLIRPIASTSC